MWHRALLLRPRTDSSQQCSSSSKSVTREEQPVPVPLSVYPFSSHSSVCVCRSTSRSSFVVSVRCTSILRGSAALSQAVIVAQLKRSLFSRSTLTHTSSSCQSSNIASQSVRLSFHLKEPTTTTTTTTEKAQAAPRAVDRLQSTVAAASRVLSTTHTPDRQPFLPIAESNLLQQLKKTKVCCGRADYGQVRRREERKVYSQRHCVAIAA